MNLPFQPPVPPMLAQLSRTLPDGPEWLFEPKWDGFRAIVFWDGTEMLLQSRDLKPLGRYFPELEQSLREVLAPGLVLDGEIVIAGPHGLDFDALLMRIHPAASRVNKLAAETPSSLVAFDCLAAGGDDFRNAPQRVRRKRLEQELAGCRPPLYLTPLTADRTQASDWFERFEGAGLDGVVAKRAELPYQPDVRAMIKVKHQRTADCVVAGFRWAANQTGEAVGSLLLGLYDPNRVLHYVGHTSSFKKPERRELVGLLEPFRDPGGQAGFGMGRAPGGPSRWNQKEQPWEALRPELICEVSFDHLQGDRFRHAATFVRWRPDKPREACTYEQLETPVPYELGAIFGKSRSGA